MQIVIDISKHIYEHAKEQSEDSNDEWDAMRAIANGTLFPKGHGRLIDADALAEKAPEIQEYLEVLASTIIEADKAESEVQDENSDYYT